MKRVDFFIAGNLKSGTTTYYQLLKQHPEIFVPEYKEPKFFCTDFHKESDDFHGRRVNYPIRTLEKYQQLFTNGHDNQLFGDCTPHYTYSKEAAENIYKHNPKAKILIFLREPVSFLRSLHFDSLHALNEVEKDFIKALELEDSRRSGENIPPKISAPSYLFYSDWVKYEEQIRRYVDLFGADRVKIVFLKQIIKDQESVYKDILSFLNVKDTNFKPDYSINKNSSRELRWGFIFKRVKHSKLWNTVGRLLPVNFYSTLGSIIDKTFFVKAKKDPLPAKKILTLKKRYLSIVISLNKYLNKEGLIDFNLLEFWGYEKQIVDES